VVAVVLADGRTDLAATVDAIRRQVYVPERLVIVGGGTAARHEAEAAGAGWMANLAAVLDATPTSVTHLWILHAGAMPRPTALGALVTESERVGAGIAGSKLLDGEDPSRLRNVGWVTDVFDEPSTGLDPDERDQGQYDVVRDVAAVSGVSMLLRRDLARGLRGPDPRLAPVAAAVDLCQRARLRGARVVVVPSSEVLVGPAGPGRRWREDAGRLRAMLKAYGPVTLAWAIPVRLLVGFLGVLLALVLGRWRLFDWMRAWAWNLVYLPSTLAERRRARRGRVVGDAELFRYQLGGSTELRSLLGEVVERVRARLPGEDRIALEVVGRDLRQPAVVTGLLAVGFTLLATRSIWAAGLPAVGSSLPFPAPGTAALRAYAGGWNPAGLGSVAPLRPLVAVAGVLETVLFGRRLAEYALVAGSALLGIWGTTRLLRTFSVEAPAGVAAGLVLVFGPMAQGIAGATNLGTLAAVGILPWALRLPLAPFPASSPGRVGRLAATAAVLGLLGALAPPLLLAPSVLLLLWAAITLTEARAWRAVAVAIVGTMAAVPLLFPWLGHVDLVDFVTSGRSWWDTSVVVAGAFAAAVLLGLLAAPRRLAFVVGWGAVLAAGGAALSRAGAFGVGAEAGAAGLAVGSLGLALVVGAVLDGVRRVEEVAGWRRFVLGVAAVGAALLVVTTAAVTIGGRAGLPGDRLRGVLAVTRAATTDPATSRVLMLGPADLLPGESRSLRDGSYRVVSAPLPALWEADLAAPRAGDEALAATLGTIVDEETTRAGEALAPFGIRWVVVVGEAEGPRADVETRAWLDVLAGQLDLVPLGRTPGAAVFVNEAEDAVRAATEGGRAWVWRGGRYVGTPESDGRVILAENAHRNWGPGPWTQVEWRNEVAASAGEAAFRPLAGRRRQASTAGVWLLVLLAFAGWGRRRR